MTTPANRPAEHCPAVLTHAHGVSPCRLAPPHEGEHTADCAICIENEDDPTLEWAETVEDWTRR